MTAQITQHSDGFSVEDETTGADYSDIRFTKRAAERVAELIDSGKPDWDDIAPVLDAEKIEVMA